jgi:hypothetical protein
VDGLETAVERQAAIAASGKPKLLQLDFVGNSGRHKLISTADILGEDVEDDVIERAVAKVRRKGGAADMREELAEVQEEIRAERRAELERQAAEARRIVKGKATYTTRAVSPFDVFDTTPRREPGWHRGRKPTPGQLNALARFKIPVPPDCSFSAASQLLDTAIGRCNRGLATYKQVQLLQKYGFKDALEITFVEASRRLNELEKGGWRRLPEPASPPY